MPKKKHYGLAERQTTKTVRAPDLPYRPQNPRSYSPGLGLIGCGGISEQHLRAYKKAGFRVLALCDRWEERARNRQREFYPDAAVFTNYTQLLKRDDIEVVDIATHPKQREPIIRDAILAGKHVLSQKPFATDIDFGRRMVDLAEKQKVKLAVNCNGRWAPHFSYMRHAIQQGLIGDVVSVNCSVHWNHNWIAETEFNKVRHIILYDFGIHWFDIVRCFISHRTPERVYASFTASPTQQAKPPLIAQALIECEGSQATLAFVGDTRFGPQDETYVAGSKGSIGSSGPDLMEQTVTIHLDKGIAQPKLKGNWFPDGFHGTMAELLCAIEEDREPFNSAADHLKSLELCFAAVASAEEHEPKVPGEVRRLPAE